MRTYARLEIALVLCGHGRIINDAVAQHPVLQKEQGHGAEMFRFEEFLQHRNTEKETFASPIYPR